MKPRLRNFVLYIALPFIVLAVATALLAPGLVSNDQVRKAMERELSNFAGRPVSLAGDVTVRLQPSPVAIFENVIFPARGDEKQPLLVVENIEADIAAFTLLSRNPKFTNFKLNKPKLNLMIEAEGGINWRNHLNLIGRAVDLVEDKSTETDQTGLTAQLLPDSFPSQMATLNVHEGTIVIARAGANQKEEISKFSGTISWTDLNSSLQAVGTAFWRDTEISFDLFAAQPLAFFAKKETKAKIQIQSELAYLNYDGSLAYDDNLFADGLIEFSTPSVSSMLDFLASDIDLVNAVGPLNINGPINVSNQRVRLEQTSISINENVGSGIIEFASTAGEPSTLTGTLDFETLNLVSLLDAFVKLPPIQPRPDVLTTVEFTSKIRTDLRLSAKQAQLGPVALSNLAATAQINEDSAIFDIGDALAYDGNVQARLQLKQTNPQESGAFLSVSGQGVDTRNAAESFSLPRSMPLGTAELLIDLEAPIARWDTMLRTAKGRTTFKMNNGVIEGFGIAAFLENENLDQFFTLWSSDQNNEPFDTLKLEGAVGDGVVSIENAEIQYPKGTVHLKGVAPYGSGGIALTATVTPHETSESANESAFFIGGSWDRAFATPLKSTPVLDE